MTTKLRTVDDMITGRCTQCLRPTRSIAAVHAEPEYIIVMYQRLFGLPHDVAVRVLERATGCDPGMVPAGDDDGRISLAIDLCATCADQHGIPVTTLTGDPDQMMTMVAIPAVDQRDRGDA